MNCRLLVVCLGLLVALCLAESTKEAQPQNNDLISRAIFDKSVEPYLRADTLLLTVGGCKIIRTPEGKHLLVSVGMTETEGKSWLRIQDDVTDKPYAALARFKEVKVSTMSRMERTSSLTVVNGEEKSILKKDLIKKISSFSEGYFHQLPVIGQWFSKDGKTYYLAIGKFIELKGELE